MQNWLEEWKGAGTGEMDRSAHSVAPPLAVSAWRRWFRSNPRSCSLSEIEGVTAGAGADLVGRNRVRAEVLLGRVVAARITTAAQPRAIASAAGLLAWSAEARDPDRAQLPFGSFSGQSASYLVSSRGGQTVPGCSPQQAGRGAACRASRARPSAESGFELLAAASCGTCQEGSSGNGRHEALS